MTEEQTIRKVVFLDTMTLHYIRLCIKFAIENNFQFSTEDSAIANLENHIDSIREQSLKNALHRGLKTIILLSNADVQIEYASVSEIEMLTGIAEGKARLSLADEGVPYRIWSRNSQKETRDRMTIEELTSIKSHIDEFGSILENSGAIVVQSAKKRENEVIELAKGISNLIYMGVIDNIVFASAIAAEADYLVTADNYMMETVNFVCDSNEQRYKDIRHKLKKLINSIILGKSGDTNLPKAFTVTHTGSIKGVSSFP